MIELNAYAKVNLTLEVVARRDDGYHEIKSVMQTIGLSDQFSFEPAPEIEFTCIDSRIERPDLLNESVMGAVSLLRDETGCKDGALIKLHRMDVPRAAGLGSSSTDSAAVLKGLNNLWQLNLSIDDLIRLAGTIGSDTPFFISGGTVLTEGRGEKVTSLPKLSENWLVLLVPSFDLMMNKTAKMYARLENIHFTDGSPTEELTKNLENGEFLSSAMLYNIFESVAFDFFRGLSDYRRVLLDAGAKGVHLAGSGPALFTLVSNPGEGEEIVGRLMSEGLNAYLIHTV